MSAPLDFFDLCGSGLLVVNSFGLIVKANAAAETLFENTHLEGQRIIDFVSKLKTGLCMLNVGEKTKTIQLTISMANANIYCSVVEVKSLDEDLLKEKERLEKLVDSLVDVSITDISRRKALEDRLRAERDRSESLLMSILPVAIIPRLQGRRLTTVQEEDPIADFFPEGSICFVDIVQFTKMASDLTAVEVVMLLNELFNTFDALVDTFKLTKIKTIGDTYMVVGGVPTPVEDHADRVLSFSVAMIQAVEGFNQNRAQNRQIQIRVGVASGPMVAGVVGSARFLYDIWGETVNLASRMQSSGVAGKIHVSQSTLDALKEEEFLFARRTEEIDAKATYFVKVPQ